MTNLQNQLITLAHQLKISYLKDPKHHQQSLAFKNMIQKVKQAKIGNFKIPEKFPQQVSEGVLRCENTMRISLFFVPKGAKIPIHDHPKMFVICKLLRGKLIYHQYSLQQNTHQITSPQRYLLSKKNQSHFNFPIIPATKITKIVQQNSLSFITPEVNLHSMEAEEDSIFLDIICPDYDQVQIFLNVYDELEKVEKDKVLLKMGPPKLDNVPLVEVGFM